MNLTTANLNWQCSAAIDASQLGLSPGEWPNRITVKGPNNSLLVLDRIAFVRADPKSQVYEIGHAVYAAGEGDRRFELTVFND